MAIQSFEDLLVWQKARSLASQIYKATENFPRHELFGLTSQIHRAAVSIVANIAEGSARHTSATFANHLDIAIGSAAELLAHLHIAEDIGYLPTDTKKPLVTQLVEVSKMVHRLHTTIRNRK